jgi:hypothetical protein
MFQEGKLFLLKKIQTMYSTTSHITVYKRRKLDRMYDIASTIKPWRG